MAQAVVVRTPTDFELTLGCSDFVKAPLVSPSSEIEPAFRNAVSGIFQDLVYIDSRDPDLVASYLEGIAEPLAELQALGFSILAIKTKGELTLPENSSGVSSGGTIPWMRTYYLIGPTNGYFAVGTDSTNTVHSFSRPCRRAVDSLSKAAAKGTPLSVWVSSDVLRTALEYVVPWCKECCFEESVQL